MRPFDHIAVPAWVARAWSSWCEFARNPRKWRADHKLANIRAKRRALQAQASQARAAHKPTREIIRQLNEVVRLELRMELAYEHRR